MGLETVNLRLARPQIHILNFDKLGPLVELITEKQCREDWDVDIGRHEGLCTEVSGEEAIEAIEDRDSDTEGETEVSEERLPVISNKIMI